MRFMYVAGVLVFALIIPFFVAEEDPVRKFTKSPDIGRRQLAEVLSAP